MLWSNEPKNEHRAVQMFSLSTQAFCLLKNEEYLHYPAECYKSFCNGVISFHFDLRKICYESEKVQFIWLQRLFEGLEKFPPVCTVKAFWHVKQKEEGFALAGVYKLFLWVVLFAILVLLLTFHLVIQLALVEFSVSGAPMFIYDANG